MTPTMIPCPFIGRFHFAWHLKGVMSMGFIIAYWFYNTQMITWVVFYPGYYEGKVAMSIIIVYWIVAVNCFLCIFKASSLHPGRVPSISTAKSEKGWTYCDKCCIKRPPRAHHCRRCQHCVTRLDHHCPWINNCVGNDNHYAFIQLLCYAIGLSLLSVVIALMHIFLYSPCTVCDRTEYIHAHSTVVMVTVVILGLVMGLLMSSMLFVQYFNFMTDRTTLQNIIEPPTVEVDWSDDTCVNVFAKYFGPGFCFQWMWPCWRKPNELLEARADIV